MGGRVVGYCLIGKGVKEKQVPLSILLENGLLILMTKVPTYPLTQILISSFNVPLN